jgi:HEAT repeat protein
LRRHDSDLEVAVPVYQMEIAIASPNHAGIPVGMPELALANELVSAIQSGPETIGRMAATYSSWAEELIGKQALPLVEPFLKSNDPLVRYQAAWWLSFRKVDAAVVGELKKTFLDQNVEEWARSGARERLSDMAAGRYVP